MAKKEKKEAAGAPAWMATYGDLVTLLMVFFILLFSMATLDAQKFEELSFSLKSSLISKANGERLYSNRGQSMITIDYVNPDDTGKLEVDKKKYKETSEGITEIITDVESELKHIKMEEALEKLEDKISELGLQNQISIEETSNAYIIKTNNSAIQFPPGNADIKPGSETAKFIEEVIAPLIRESESEVLVQGHTDNAPINTSQFASNWELSTHRATNVVKYLQEYEGIDPSIMSAVGCGEYKPVATNDTEQGRAQNRRMEIVLLKNGDITGGEEIE